MVRQWGPLVTFVFDDRGFMGFDWKNNLPATKNAIDSVKVAHIPPFIHTPLRRPPTPTASNSRSHSLPPPTHPPPSPQMLVRQVTVEHRSCPLLHASTRTLAILCAKTVLRFGRGPRINGRATGGFFQPRFPAFIHQRWRFRWENRPFHKKKKTVSREHTHPPKH